MNSQPDATVDVASRPKQRSSRTREFVTATSIANKAPGEATTRACADREYKYDVNGASNGDYCFTCTDGTFVAHNGREQCLKSNCTANQEIITDFTFTPGVYNAVRRLLDTEKRPSCRCLEPLVNPEPEPEPVILHAGQCNADAGALHAGQCDADAGALHAGQCDPVAVAIHAGHRQCDPVAVDIAQHEQPSRADPNNAGFGRGSHADCQAGSRHPQGLYLHNYNVVFSMLNIYTYTMRQKINITRIIVQGISAGVPGVALQFDETNTAKLDRPVIQAPAARIAAFCAGE
eukprot:tig00000767_g3969.t1